MTADDQSKAIAHALGRCTHPISDWVHEGPDGDREILCGVCRQRPYTVGFPDYTRDLNATAEAEKTLTVEQRLTYRRNLCAAVGGSHTNLKSFEQITATAEQRAEAFLRTIGKWQD